MINILFDSRNWLVALNTKLHHHFANHHSDINPISVFHNKIELKQSNLKQNYLVLNDYYEVGRVYYDAKGLQQLEYKYNIPSLWKIVNQDRFLRNCTYSKIVEYLSYYFFAYENILSKSQFNIIVSETVTGVWNAILYYLANYHGIQYFGYLSTRTTNKLYFNHCIYDRFSEFEKLYIKNRSTQLSSDESKIIEFFLFDKEKSIKPEYVKQTEKQLSISDVVFSKKYIKELLKKLFFADAIKGDITFAERHNPFTSDLGRALRIKLLNFSSFFDNVKEGERYILFPLHYQPEATTDVWADVYRDQLYTIKLISQSIPFGYKIYVKEHSSFLGSRSVRFYLELNKIPNVKLISWRSNSLSLMRSASLVITLSGTMGLEAIFYSIPVVVFGNVFYDFYEHAYKVTNPYELPELIKIALTTEIVQQHRLNFLLAYLQSGYDISLFGEILTETSVQKLAQYILDEFKKMEKINNNRPRI